MSVHNPCSHNDSSLLAPQRRCMPTSRSPTDKQSWFYKQKWNATFLSMMLLWMTQRMQFDVEVCNVCVCVLSFSIVLVWVASWLVCPCCCWMVCQHQCAQQLGVVCGHLHACIRLRSVFCCIVKLEILLGSSSRVILPLGSCENDEICFVFWWWPNWRWCQHGRITWRQRCKFVRDGEVEFAHSPRFLHLHTLLSVLQPTRQIPWGGSIECGRRIEADGEKGGSQVWRRQWSPARLHSI